jgi:dienelactone hydrolase
MKMIVCVALSLLASGSSASAQSSFSGSWDVDADPPWTVVFRANEPTVIGRVSRCSSQVTAEIFDARIEGNVISFKCRSGDGDRTLTLRGTLSGDAIAFTWTQEVRPGGSAVDANANGRIGILGPASPATFTARRVADGPLAAEVDRVLGNELAAAINNPDQDLKGESVLFLPQGPTPIRAVIVTIGWGLGFEVYLDQRVRRFAADTRLAVMRVSVRHIAEPNASLIGPGRIPPVAASRILTNLLQRYAAETGRGELASAPLLLWGHSAGGGLVAGLATQLRERVIGLVRYHSGGGGGDLKVLTELPALILVGGKDAGTGSAAEQMAREGRAAGAPWTFGIEPQATHQDPKDLAAASSLLVTWMSAVMQRRIGAGGQALQAVTDAGAWLGDPSTGQIALAASFLGDKAKAFWLPDEPTAREWRKVVRPE